jgi:hypothetical protein
VADGELSADEVEQLETIQRKGELSPEDVRSAGLALYHEAIDAAAADARLTAEEDAALRRLQQQLELSDTDLGDAQAQIVRLRLLARIEQGNLSEMRSPIPLEPGELCYWVVQCTQAERLALHARPQEIAGSTFAVTDTAPFAITGDLAALRPAEDILPRDPGVLLVTSDRLVFHGARRTMSIAHGRTTSVTVFLDGIRIDAVDPAERRYFLLDDPQLAAAVLLRAARNDAGSQPA